MDKVAVVGLGNIAMRHRRNLKMLFPNATLFAMSASGRIPSETVDHCDVIVDNIEVLVKENINLVIVASPAPFHAKHSIPFIEAGVPTLIEKPISAKFDDAKAIQLAIEEYKTPVVVGYCLRYLPSAKKLKEILGKSIIGTIYNAHIEVGQYLPDWRPNKNYRDCVSANKKLGGGVLLELSHELDYAQWLLGPLHLKNAILRSSIELNLDVEDIADIVALSEDGVVTTIHMDFLQLKAYRKCSFVGSLGRIDWDLINNQLLLITATEALVLYSEPEWDKNKMYLSMVEDFVQMIEQNSHGCSELDESIKIVSLIEKIKQQASIY